MSPPMFGRATIRLGIGSHSSFLLKLSYNSSPTPTWPGLCWARNLNTAYFRQCLLQVKNKLRSCIQWILDVSYAGCGFGHLIKRTPFEALYKGYCWLTEKRRKANLGLCPKKRPTVVLLYFDRPIHEPILAVLAGNQNMLCFSTSPN